MVLRSNFAQVDVLFDSLTLNCLEVLVDLGFVMGGFLSFLNEFLRVEALEWFVFSNVDSVFD